MFQGINLVCFIFKKSEIESVFQSYNKATIANDAFWNENNSISGFSGWEFSWCTSILFFFCGKHLPLDKFLKKEVLKKI